MGLCALGELLMPRFGKERIPVLRMGNQTDRYIARVMVRAAQSQRECLKQAPGVFDCWCCSLGRSKAAVLDLPDAFDEKVLPSDKGRGGKGVVRRAGQSSNCLLSGPRT